MREINRIIVHCSATKPDMDIGVAEIRDWHVNGNGWHDIGYHYVIRRNGKIEDGRALDRTGAHTKGYNTGSIGICLVGGIDEEGKADANFTIDQYSALDILIADLLIEYPNSSLHGHRDFSNKDCPCFDVKELVNFA